MSTATDPNPPTVKDGIGAAVTRIDGPAAAAACNAILHATSARIRDLPVRIEKLLGGSA